MNNQDFLKKRFNELHDENIPAFLMGDDNYRLLAYPAFSHLESRAKIIYILAYENEITVDMASVGLEMLIEYAKYVLFFDKEAAQSVADYYRLYDKHMAMTCSKKDIDRAVKIQIETYQQETTFTPEILCYDDLFDILEMIAPDLLEEYNSLTECEDGECPCCAAMKNAGRTSKH